MRYIDADIAKEKLKEYCVDDDNTVRYWYDLMGIDDCIDKIIPTADVRENVRGYWKKRKDKPLQNWYQCSNCGAICGETPKYCSECGADMRGEA